MKNRVRQRDTVRIGCGAGFAGDRIDAAVELARHGNLDVLVLECLAERTIALAQCRRSSDADSGYDMLAEHRFRALLPETLPRGIRIISNLGAANPREAGGLAIRTAQQLGLDCRVAIVTGDDVLDKIDPTTLALEDGKPLSAHGPIISANAYLGADALLDGLRAGADVVITGRVADPSLFVAPLIDRLGWGTETQDRWRPPPWRATSSSVEHRSAEAISPIPAISQYRIWLPWGCPSPISPPMESLKSARLTAPGD